MLLFSCAIRHTLRTRKLLGWLVVICINLFLFYFPFIHLCKRNLFIFGVKIYYIICVLFYLYLTHVACQ